MKFIGIFFSILLILSLFKLTCTAESNYNTEASNKQKFKIEIIDSINYLNSKSFNYIGSNSDSTKLYSESALKLSKLIHNDSLIAVSMVNLAFSNKENIDSNLKLYYLKDALNLFQLKNDKYGEALILLKIGDNFLKLNNYTESLYYYNLALNIYKQLNNSRKVANTLYYKIAELYIIRSDYTKAINILFQALKISEENNDSSCIADAQTNIGFLYIMQNKYSNAKPYFDKALVTNRKLERNLQIAKCLINLGVYYFNTDSVYYALNYYLEALNIYNQNGKKVAVELYINIGQIYQSLKKYDVARTYYNKAIEIAEDEKSKESKYWAYIYIGDFFIETGELTKAKKYFISGKTIAEEVCNLSWLSYVYQILALISQKSNDYKSAYEYNLLYNKFKDSLLNQEKILNINKIENQFEQEKRDAVSRQEKKTLSIIMISFIIGSGLFLALAFYIYINYRNKKKANVQLEEKNKIISYEQKKSDNLLLNILPDTIANRLKDGEQTIADHFDGASVVFVDQVDFTKKSSLNTPENVVQILNNIYTEFDKIAGKFKLEKIKTIGDCYMAASGVPTPNDNHSQAAAYFALEVLEKMRDYKIDDETIIQFRVGIDCGPVVAGIIGENKFIYDLWGDTVNTASRMEQYGIPGRIQITERFKESLENSQKLEAGSQKSEVGSNKFVFEERGEVEIKGKGKMRTWFLVCNKD